MSLFDYFKTASKQAPKDDVSKRIETMKREQAEQKEVFDPYFTTGAEILKLASELRQQKIKDGPQMDELIHLCYRQIDQWANVKRISEEQKMALPKTCVGFERLAMIYDQQRENEKCLKICMMAIDNGLPKDKYSSRIAKVLKRLEIEDTKPYQKYLP